MYKKVDTSLNFLGEEKEVLNFWKENGIFEKSVKQNEGNEEFTFYDGPPTANGKPHIGHILTRVIKDIIPRYQTMKGKHVLRKAGWDTHRRDQQDRRAPAAPSHLLLPLPCSSSTAEWGPVSYSAAASCAETD